MAIDLSSEAQEKLDTRSEPILRELHNEIRALRETELKLVPLFFQVSAFIVATNVFLAGPTVPKEVATLLMALSIIFIASFWRMTHTRITHDHHSYEYLAERVRYIRMQWGLNDFFKSSERQNNFGSGLGYKRNQRLVAMSGFFVILFIVIGIVSRWCKI